MKKTVATMGLVAVCGLGQPMAASDEHPELDPADIAYSAENYEKAAALYRKDAELGVISAQVNLAIMYLEGQGVAEDYGQAAKWFQRAADQGNAEAQQNLGLLYRDGKGVSQNPVEALKWFVIAGADGEIRDAEKNLSVAQIAEARRLANDWIARFKRSKETQ